jgi:hypothetical protein
MLPKLNLPNLPLRLKTENGQSKIFDPVRKKWLLLTPEEWVRQSFLLFMHHYHNYPLSLAETEKVLNLNKTVKRADIVFNDNNLNPRVIVECKAPEIKLTNKVFEQVNRYYFALKADVLIVTNGMEHFAFQFKDNKVEFLNEIPNYQTIIK